MSHNVTVKGAVFDNIELMEDAVASLASEGVNVSFVTENATIRGWRGQKSTVDAAILLADSKYDIGFKQNSEGLYEAFGEDYLTKGHGAHLSPIGQHTPYVNQEGEEVVPDTATRLLGKFAMHYNVCKAERQMEAEGLSCQRETQDDGTIQLIATQY